MSVDLFRLLIAVAAGIGAAATIGGAAWWLLRPRVDDYLERMVRTSEEATAGCTRRLEAVADKLEAHDNRLTTLERTRTPEEFLETVELIDAVLKHRPRTTE